MYCRNCGKEIDDKAVVCIYCGVPTGIQNQYAPAQQESNIFAILGFALSFFTVIVGLVFSIIGYKNSKLPQYNGNGRGFAIAGIVISSIVLGICFIAVIVVIAAVSCAVTTPYYYYW